MTDIEAVLDAYRNPGVYVDLGCGADKNPGFLGIDKRDLPGVDIVHDLEVLPWPLPDECVSLLVASHLVEHITPIHGFFIDWMNEAWRVMREGCTFMISTPYAGSLGYWSDPTHVNPCTEATWGYFDPIHPRALTAEGNRLWDIYKPRPWRIAQNAWDTNGNLEIQLVKLPMSVVEGGDDDE